MVKFFSRKFIGKAVIFLVSILIIVLILSFADLKEVYANLRLITYFDILVALLIMTTSMLLRVFRWRLILSDEKKVSFVRITPVYFLGQAIAGFTPGNIGDPVRSVILKKTEGIPISNSIKSIMAERITDLLAVIFLSLYVLVFYLGGYIGGVKIGYGILLVLILTMMLLLFSRRCSFFILNMLARLFRRNEKLSRFIDSFIESFCNSRMRKRTFLSAMVLALILWILDGMIFFYIFERLGMNLEAGFVISAFALSVIIGLITFLPGGIGSFEGSFLILLISAGVEKNTAIAGIFITRFMVYAYPLILAYISFLTIRKMTNKTDKTDKTDSDSKFT